MVTNALDGEKRLDENGQLKTVTVTNRNTVVKFCHSNFVTKIYRN